MVEEEYEEIVPVPEPVPTVDVAIGDGDDSVEAVVAVKETADGSVEMSLSFNADTFDGLIEDAVENLAEGETVAEIAIDLTGDSFADVSVFNVAIPAAAFADVSQRVNVVITTEFGVLTVSSNVLQALMKIHGDVVTLTIRRG